MGRRRPGTRATPATASPPPPPSLVFVASGSPDLSRAPLLSKPSATPSMAAPQAFGTSYLSPLFPSRSVEGSLLAPPVIPLPATPSVLATLISDVVLPPPVCSGLTALADYEHSTALPPPMVRPIPPPVEGSLLAPPELSMSVGAVSGPLTEPKGDVVAGFPFSGGAGEDSETQSQSLHESALGQIPIKLVVDLSVNPQSAISPICDPTRSKPAHQISAPLSVGVVSQDGPAPISTSVGFPPLPSTRGAANSSRSSSHPAVDRNLGIIYIPTAPAAQRLRTPVHF